MVGAKGFEPSTPRSRTVCATRLRYAPYMDNNFTGHCMSSYLAGCSVMSLSAQ
jgi:hypothetical protein